MSSERFEYYAKKYSGIQRSGIQGWGNSLIDRLIEKKVRRQFGMRILEVGASSGEHLLYVSKEPFWEEYIALDINPGISNPDLYSEVVGNRSSNFPSVKFVAGNAEEMPFDDDTFDLVVSTCLLAHVKEPEKVLSEIRRVVRGGGQVVIGLPTDPGILNRLVKVIITYPKMRRHGVSNPRLEYAREHINGVGNLIEMAKFLFMEDQVKFRYYPFFVRSWNANLAVVLICRVEKQKS
jgi:ubiquinone/menaquinone biosynthesis C-methylase UbiE